MEQQDAEMQATRTTALPPSGSAQSEDEEKQPSSLESVARAPNKDYEVKFDGETDPMNPRSMPKARKWSIVLILAFSSFCVTVNSSIYTFTYTNIEPRFGISEEVATLGLSTFVIGLALGPMFLAPLSEFYGRRPIYIASLFMVLMFLLPCGLAQNIQTILITRFFDGVFGSAFLSVSGGSVGDLFNKQELSNPMMIYSGSPFIGPAIGPVIGGFINSYTTWRWTFWTLMIWTGVQLTLVTFFVPETYHPVLLRRKAQRLRAETGNENWKAPIEIMSKSIAKTVLWSCIRPFELLVNEPMCLHLSLLSALLLGILYLFFGAFPLIFRENHGFNLWQTGLAFLGMFVGMALAMFSDPIWRWNYRRLLRSSNGVSEPEYRLPPCVFGAIVVPMALFGFGWTTYHSVPWIVPLIFSGFFGLGIITCYAGIFTFKVEAYPLYAASALAANSFVRSVFAASFPLFGVQMFNTLGFQWASSLLAFLALALAPFPYIFFRYGKRIRGKSRFAGTSTAR